MIADFLHSLPHPNSQIVGGLQDCAEDCIGIYGKNKDTNALETCAVRCYDKAMEQVPKEVEKAVQDIKRAGYSL
jgi:hypothetical protein